MALSRAHKCKQDFNLKIMHPAIRTFQKVMNNQVYHQENLQKINKKKKLGYLEVIYYLQMIKRMKTMRVLPLQNLEINFE